MSSIEENNKNIEEDLEWEEWDGSSPFIHHCIAGGIAGVAEHTLLYPVDTIKTHMQSYCADCPHNVKNASSKASSSASSAIRPSVGGTADQGMWRTVQNIVLHGNNTHTKTSTSRISLGGNSVGSTTRTSRPATNIAATCFPEASASALNEVIPRPNFATGFGRLWRGVQTMAVGCAPAHALYFSSYEAVKNLFLAQQQSNALEKQHHLSPLGSSVAGATATVFHDLIMTPLDTIKQRLQLGHYEGMHNGLQNVIKYEGYIGLYRSFPVTLLTNVPYGMVMVSTNEFLKELMNPDGHFNLESCLVAGCGAGFVAAAVTTPLDRVKTRLQTQTLGSGRTTKCGRPILLQQYPSIKYEGWRDALKSIIREEGHAGLFRGIAPRVMMHSPAVAISWTTYEGAKNWLLSFSD